MILFSVFFVKLKKPILKIEGQEDVVLALPQKNIFLESFDFS